MAANNLNRLYKLFAVFFLLILLQECKHRDNNITHISGNIKNHSKSPQKLYLYLLPDSITFYNTDKIVLDSCRIGEDGRFDFKLNKLIKSTFFDLSIGDLVIARNYFIQPNQALYLELDASYLPAQLINLKNVDRYNQFLQTYSDTFYRKPEVKQYYYVQSNFLLAPEYAKYIDERHLHQLEFASNILSDANSDKLFVNYLQSEIDYQWANDKTAFLWKKWIRNEEVKLDTAYYNYASKLIIDNPDALVSPAYIRFLHLYIRELHRQLPIQIQNRTEGTIKRCEIASKCLKGNALKIALFHIMKDELSNVKSLGIVDEKRKLKLNELTNYIVKISNDSTYLNYISKY